MRTIIKNQDFSSQTIEDLQGYYDSCNFNGCTFTGEIYAVLKDCTADPLTLKNANIKRLFTPDTPLPNVTIDKPTFQPVHLLKVMTELSHNHQYVTGRMRKYARASLSGRKRNVVLKACDYVDAHPEYSWKDFVFKLEVPKEVWELAEQYFSEDAELLKEATSARRIRWP